MNSHDYEQLSEKEIIKLQGIIQYIIIHNLGFSFLLNKVFIAASKPNAKRNKTGFIFYASDSPPLTSRAKNKTSFKFLFYFRFDSVN